ncbi:MAG: hypothetical protein QXG39_06270 [Candidatus Aenigmatarchaeota archaeon]
MQTLTCIVIIVHGVILLSNGIVQKGVSRVMVTEKGNEMNPRLRFILTHLYCGRCMQWYSLERVLWEGRRPICPRCYSMLRIKTRKAKRQKITQMKKFILEHFEAHHRIPDFFKVLIRKR